jgi:hypothetical protein
MHPSALFSKLPETIKSQIDDLFPDGRVPTSRVDCGVFLAVGDLFRVEQLPGSPRADFLVHHWLQINNNREQKTLPALISEKNASSQSLFGFSDGI